MPTETRRRLIVALDFDRLSPAFEMARRLAGVVGMFKIGKQLFTAEGPEAVRQIAPLGLPIFLDLKFHDIPNTVAAAVTAACALPGVELLTVHALGGGAMMRAAGRAAISDHPSFAGRPKVLAVTLLTSLDTAALREIGLTGTLVARAVHLARLARRAKLEGVVASPREIRHIRAACGKNFLIVAPGIRPLGSAAADQQRIASPAEAIRAGADYLVVGRPITQASDPVAATESIIREMEQAASRRA